MEKMQQLSRGQATLIREIALNNGFTELEIQTSAGSAKGDNYMGIVTAIALRDEKKIMNLIMKASHSNKEFRIAACVKDVFAREIYLYDKVFPELEQFQHDFKLKFPFQGFAKYYGSYVEDNNESLVMEDLKKVGYSLWDRKIPMNRAHITAVLKEYAKLHSASLALQQRKPKTFDTIKNKMFDIYAETYTMDDTKLKAFTDQMMMKALRIAEGNDTATRILEEVLPKLPSYYKNELLDPEYQRVFVHGDCWCNNLMFQYGDKKYPTVPTKTCIIDWQISKCSSPALDLVYFLFCSATKDILRDFKQYLWSYYEVFSENLRSVGCDPDSVFPFSMLEKHFKKFAKFGMITAIMNLQIILCDEQEAPDLSNTTDGDLMKILDIKSARSDEANKRILDLILFMVDNDLF